MTDQLDDLQHLHERAYAAVDEGELTDAARDFAALLEHTPENPYYHYMQGLVHKYLLDWPTSLRHNLQAIELAEEFSQAQHWNAAIAATALGEWQTVRALWSACGINVPEGSGAIEADFGMSVVRLNPWHGGETVFMRRIDPVRARLLNVPLPESGHRFGDIVLHDGASTGERMLGDRAVPVFNAMARLQASEFQTFVCFIRCESRTDLDALLRATAPGIGLSEDWTDSIRYVCLRCSYGAPHAHEEKDDSAEWQSERNLGIAAQSRKSVEKLLKDWASGHASRHIDAIETRECTPPACEPGNTWWMSIDDEADDEAPDDDAE